MANGRVLPSGPPFSAGRCRPARCNSRLKRELMNAPTARMSPRKRSLAKSRTARRSHCPSGLSVATTRPLIAPKNATVPPARWKPWAKPSRSAPEGIAKDQHRPAARLGPNLTLHPFKHMIHGPFWIGEVLPLRDR